jgi:CBS domain-containing protein
MEVFMSTVKDIMVGIFDYPHIPYWFAISQAVRIVRVSFINSKNYPEPIVILIFDEKYNLIGSLTMRDILKGIEPTLASGKAKELKEESIQLDSIFGVTAKETLSKTVSEIMVPISTFVEPHDPVTKAAYLMVKNNLVILPVLEDKKKLVGLVRMLDVFDHISNRIFL